MSNVPETELHSLLKEVGRAFLFNQRCFIVATEVWVHRIHVKGFSSLFLKLRSVIDVCGFGEKYIPETQRQYRYRKADFLGKEIEVRDRVGPYKYNVIRGIEVKVSRSDFNNGFICSGCNYHYILIPKGLVQPTEVPKHIGIIEVDVPNFKSFFGVDNRFSLTGLKLIKKPTFQKLESWQIDSMLSEISARCGRELISKTAKKLGSLNNTPVYARDIKPFKTIQSKLIPLDSKL